MNLSIAAIALYVVFQVAIGVWASRFVKTAEDYNLAGRSIGLGLAMFSLFATWFGAETVMGSAAAIADEGLSGGRADPFGYTVCLVLMGFFIAYELRHRGYVTLGDFYRERFGRRAEFLTVLVMLPTSLFWAATQLLAFGHIIAVVAGITLTTALLTATALVVGYTMLGGLLADVVSDFLQGIVLIIGLAVMLIFVILQAGGIEAAVSMVEPAQLKLAGEGESFLSAFDAWLVPVLGSLVAQEAVSRFLATKSPQTARNACFVGGGLYLVVGLIPVVIALVATHFDLGLEHRDAFMPELAKTLLPPWLFVVFIGALLSAILSTVDSTLLTVSTLTAHNLILPRWKSATEKQRLRLNRGITAVAGILTLCIALGGENIYSLAELSSSFGSAGFLVTFFVGLWLPRWGKGSSAIAALLAGVAISLLSNVVDMEAPYMTAILCSLGVYAAAALLEKTSPRAAHLTS